MQKISYKTNRYRDRSTGLHRWGHVAAALFLVLVLGVTALSVIALPVAADGTTHTVSSTDLGETDIAIPQGDVVAGLLGDIPVSEINYLNVHSRYVLYTSAVPADLIYAHVQGDGITVRAEEYSCTTAGMDVTWVPFFAENVTTPTELADMVRDEELQIYRAFLQGKAGDTVKVYYAANFTLPTDLALSMINEAPAAAGHLIAAMDDYLEALAEWTPKHDAYVAYREAYEAWSAAKEAYETYLEEQAVYDAWWADYDTKKAAMDAYLAQKNAYETWTKYCADLEAYEAYMALVSASPELKAEYEKDMALVLSQLSVMDRMFLVSEISGYSFEGVLSSGAADYVLNNRTMLKNIPDVNPEDVDMAVEATIALRAMISGGTDENGVLIERGYADLTEQEEKYEFYITYKDELTSHMRDLYIGMCALGEVDAVIEKMGTDVLPAYLRFLANLYVQWQLMEDGETLDPDKVHHGEPLSALIESSLVPIDTNRMEPLSEYPHPPVTSDDIPEVPYPGDPPPEAEAPGEMPPPVPDTAEAPDEPQEMPPAGEAPAVVADPGEAPATPEMTEQEQALYRDACDGLISERTEANLLSNGSLSLMMGGETVVRSGERVQIELKSWLGITEARKSVYFGVTLSEYLPLPRLTPDDPHLVFIGWSVKSEALPTRPGEDAPTLQVKDAVANMVLYPVYSYRHVPDGEASCTKDQVCTLCEEVLIPASGHEYLSEVIPPTCMEEGYTTHTCELCGAVKRDGETAPTGHTDGPSATCTEDQTCTVCGEVLDFATGHDYTSKITPPTCTEGGYTTHTCELCGDVKRDGETAPTGHTDSPAATCTEDQVCTVCGVVRHARLGHDDVSVVVAPTCIEAGYTEHTCRRCGDVRQDSELPPTAHMNGPAATCTEDQTCTVCKAVIVERLGHDDASVLVDPTCTEAGYTEHTCRRCGDVRRNGETQPTGHSYGDWVVDVEPTVYDEGHRYADCEICSYRLEERIPPKGLDPNCHQAGAAATCTEGQICTICGIVLVEPLGHDDKTTVIPPTCTTEGYTDHTCTRCGVNYRDTPTEMTEHTPTIDNPCTEDTTCTDCGTVLSPAREHEYKSTVVAPTCTEGGYTEHVCSRCGDICRDTHTDKMGHAPGDPATCTTDQLCETCGVLLEVRLDHDRRPTVIDPTCTEDGYTEYICIRCDDAYRDTYTDKTGHTEGEPATCTEDQICTVCGEMLTARLEHAYEDEVVPPTCTEDGYTEHACTRCDYAYRDAMVDKTGHTAGREATCTTDQICETCGKSLTSKLGHSYDTVKTPPTCAEQGYATHVCTRCGDLYEDDFTDPTGHTPGAEATCTEDQVCTTCDELLKEKTGHDHQATVTPPTCTAQGFTTHTCTRCGDTYEDSPVAPTEHVAEGAATCTEDQVCSACGEVLAEKTGHHQETTVVAPTCTDHGYTTYACTWCGDRYDADPTEPTGHTYGDWVTDVEPTVDTRGHRYTLCSVCGHRAEEVLEILPLPETETTTSDPQEPETAPAVTVPQVKWYAKLLGAVGLPGLVTFAGAALGGGTAGVTILVIGGIRKRRIKGASLKS